MNFWSILGIDPIDNTSIVKKAYAKKLKSHNPEDDPKGYQKLREAYDMALKYIRNNKNSTHTNNIKKEINKDSEDTFENNNLNSIKQPPPHINTFEEFTEKVLDYEEIVEEFMNKVKILYDDFFNRINIDNWITILDSDAMWYVGNKKLLYNKMIEFLIKNHYFPQNIWKLLDDNFNWKDDKEYLYRKYPEEFVNYLFKQINDSNGLRYCHFKERLVFDYDTFLKYREEAFEELSNNNFESAEECINNANKIYDKDPDVYLMRGICYLHKNEVDKALEIFEKLVQKDNNDLYARFYRARILYDKGNITTALEDCKYIEPYKFNNWDFYFLFAKCCLKSNEFDKAKELLLFLLNIDSNFFEAEYLLQEVNLQIARKIRRELKKNRKNKEIKLKLDKCYKELGMIDRNGIIKKLTFVMIRNFIVCLVILLIQMKITYSAMKILDIKDYTSVKSTVQFLTFLDKNQFIENSEDIKKLPPEISSVQGKLTDAKFLDLHRIPMKGEKGSINRIYLSLKEAEERNLFEQVTGYVCIGTLGDKKVIAIVGYEQAKQAYETGKIDFNGIIRYIPEDDLLNKVKNLNTTKNFDDEFIADIFIDTEITESSIREYALKADAMFLVIQVGIIIQGLVSVFMLVRNDRKRLYNKQDV
ncbi:lipopolysaccharide assembly protein LapB [Clostridium sp.]|uniref:tetratricopeptide repeat protein n=1 Tax=Clostridium sp. TaxID=1506 RepID=UPI00262F97C0|nr:CDC27 family protein [Clostridium sp.]